MINQFLSLQTDSPLIKPWYNGGQYGALWGQTFLDDITFAKFGQYCNSGPRGGIVDAVISGLPTGAEAADAWHPVTTTNIELVQVERKARVFFNPASPEWINQADCIDMDCDGPKVRTMWSLIC